MDRKSSTRGFTLAELLIVVAIIAVLVAIAIPVFSSQLEKSREATDLANVRSAYAEVMTAAITEDKTATYDGKVMYDSANGLYSATVSPLAQKQEDWQSALPITIGGVSSDDTDHWHGKPQPNGSCTIIYGRDNAVTINWGDGSDSGDAPSKPSTPGGGSAGVVDIPTHLNNGETFTVAQGNIYRYGGQYYVSTTTRTFDHGYCPSPEDAGWQYIAIDKNRKIRTEPDQGNNVLNLQAGDIYQVGNDYYIMKTRSDWYTIPPEGDNWVKINYSAK